jgi:energy-coupling factor transporter transmembrane protein EcfT
MKINKTLSIIAIIYLTINLLFYLHASSLNGGSSMGYIFIFPAFWIITLVTVIVLAIKYRNTWFKKKYLLSTLIALFFCTPVAISIITLIGRPSSYLAVSGSNNGKSFEEWNYYNGKPAIFKYWTNGVKDSIWVYLNKKGDTTKTEAYKNDILVRTKNYNDK